MKQLLECVPNFSEGRNKDVIRQITDAIESVRGVRLLDVDSGWATHRTVITFVGEPPEVVEAAFRAIQKACELIDMRYHSGAHPRMGATDVCPLVPVSGISLEEAAEWARRLAERVGRELDIPVYLYEAAASRPERKSLAHIRAGEYEGLPEKLAHPDWQPDFGPARFNPKSGATVIGARDFLIAYNINLNTTSTRRANSVAFDVREAGRIVKDPLTGKPVLDERGEPIRQPGALRGVRAIGWYIEEYGIAQVSMNITDLKATPLHLAFEACCESAERRGLRVTGSELVGMVPLRVLLEAGRYFLKKQRRSTGVSEEELVKIAIKSLGLSELAPFEPKKKIIEYRIAEDNDKRLINKDLRAFANEIASESPAPGGGSVSAYAGALGASLGAMVANLSAHKRGWDERWEMFSEAAETGQRLKDALLNAVDEDAHAFNAIMSALSLPKSTENEKNQRKAAIEAATRRAIEVPLRVMRTALESFALFRQMAEVGNPNSVSDVGVGALCARAAVCGAALNVLTNANSLEDRPYAQAVSSEAIQAIEEANRLEQEVLTLVRQKMGF
ncbi:MAG: glutamate formimidoyltransferase [Saprospiraceae bacterium]|nr:glutamate formimidoyltransferase [Saprospiraceae bacterium]MDW8485156.1 glutamate formimidoyltransferase [Saprospiraceae bacterium]